MKLKLHVSLGGRTKLCVLTLVFYPSMAGCWLRTKSCGNVLHMIITLLGRY